MFNAYMWQLYMQSEGKTTVALFERNFSKYCEEYVEAICDFHKVYCPSKIINDRVREKLDPDFLSELLSEFDDSFLENDEYNIESALNYIYENKLFLEEDTDKSVFDFFRVVWKALQQFLHVSCRSFLCRIILSVILTFWK